MPRVYRVKSHLSDYIAKTWEDACEFVRRECRPCEDGGWCGEEVRILWEHMTDAEIEALGEWSP